jgi:uncharacterized protein (TIGR03086 family)
MTRIAKLLQEAAATAVPVVRTIADDQFDRPTPCDEFRVRDLVNHLYHVVVSFQALARREAADFSSTPDYTADAGWRDGFAKETDKLIEAWSDPSALEGVSSGMGLPQPVLGQMILLDLILHPWDLAMATGQAYRPSPDAVADVHAMVDRMGPTAREMKVFGPELPIPPGADDFERLLARTGRDAMWTATAGR